MRNNVKMCLGVRTSQGRTVLVKNLPRHLRVQSKRWRAQTDPGFTEGLLVQGENSARRQGVLRRDPGRPTVPRELVQSWGTGEGLCSPLRAEPPVRVRASQAVNNVAAGEALGR